MTVIAWDGKTLAADKRATSGNVAYTVVKVERFGEHLLGMVGEADVAHDLREWFKAGADTRDFPKSARRDNATLVVITAGMRARAFATGPHPMLYADDQLAWGCGRDFALAAMHLGHDARRAVEVACAFDIGCGNGVDTLTLEES
jgi:sugar/nucleoside kinase (ribokinase family)